MNKKRVLFFLWSFSLGGGAEKILSTIVNNLDPEKYQIDILEIEHFDKGYEPINNSIRILKPWQDYRQSKLKRAILWRIRKFFPGLVRKLMVKDKYDIEISFTIINPPFVYSKDDNVKKIAWIHGSIEDFINDSKKRNSHREHLKNVDKIISVSEKTRESIISVYPEYKDKVITIYNGYDFESIMDKSKEDIDVLKAAYAHEKSITAAINAIYAEASKVNDYRTTQFLDWFISEQAEEEKNAADLIQKMELFGSDPRALYLLDHEFSERSYKSSAQ